MFGTFVPPEPVVEVKEEIVLPAELKRVCSCESTGNPNNEPIQFNEDGSVLRGRINPDDVGMCQINLYHHGERALELGIDLFTEEGNKEYATMLYEEQGTEPWNWSKGCWASNGG